MGGGGGAMLAVSKVEDRTVEVLFDAATSLSITSTCVINLPLAALYTNPTTSAYPSQNHRSILLPNPPSVTPPIQPLPHPHTSSNTPLNHSHLHSGTCPILHHQLPPCLIRPNNRLPVRKTNPRCPPAVHHRDPLPPHRVRHLRQLLPATCDARRRSPAAGTLEAELARVEALASPARRTGSWSSNVPYSPLTPGVVWRRAGGRRRARRPVGGEEPARRAERRSG